jgi:hypothetical protein
MTRRSKPYIVELSAARNFKLSASEWGELLGGGWARSIPDRIKTARLVHGVGGVIRACDLYLFALDRIRTVSDSWAHAWLYRVGIVRASAVGETRFDREDRVMREMAEALWIDAFLWRTSRDEKAKGANSFAWIDSDHKLEIIRALRPERISPPTEGGFLSN